MKKDVVSILRQVTKDTPPEVKQDYQTLLRCMNKGLPPASSVLSRRCTW